MLVGETTPTKYKAREEGWQLRKLENRVPKEE